MHTAQIYKKGTHSAKITASLTGSARISGHYLLYFSPVLDGKVLVQNDIMQAKGAAREIHDYREKTGKWTLWTNSLFGGMPSYLVATDYPNSWTTQTGRFS